MKRSELTFLISQRVPRCLKSPLSLNLSNRLGRQTETFTSARKLPFSMSPSQVPM